MAAELNNAPVVQIPRSVKAGKVLMLILALAGCLWTIHNWLANFDDVWNDPTCYINAADNLVRTGKLVDNGNWVSFSTAPVVEPYTEWPPGTPLFLAPFILVFHDTMLSVIIAQSVLIVLAYAALIAMASALDLDWLLTIALLAVFTFLRPFRDVNTQYGSETLFFILSIGAGYCAVKMVQVGGSKKYWTFGLLFTFLATSVRFSGVANLGWFLPLVAPVLTLKKSPDDRVTRLIGRVMLIMGILILTGSIWVDAIGFFVPHRIHLLHFIFLMVGSAAFVLGLGFMPGIEAGSYSVDRSVTPGWISRVNLLRALIVAAAFGPVIIWFVRNKIMYGFMTRSHGLFTEFNPQGIIEAPLMLVFYMLQDTLVHQTALFALLMLLALMPLMIGGSKERTIGLMLLWATLFQVGTMWGSSLVAMFAYLNGRLLSPAILLGALAALYGLRVLYRANRQSSLRYLLLVLPFLLLATSEHADFRSPNLSSWKVNYPKEMYLWEQIHKMAWTLRSSEVYTDLNYRHQMFTCIPQKIYWDTNLLEEPAGLKGLFAGGHRPFLVFPENSGENKAIRETIRKYDFPVDSVTYPDMGYVLYYQPPPGK